VKAAEMKHVVVVWGFFGRWLLWVLDFIFFLNTLKAKLDLTSRQVTKLQILINQWVGRSQE